VLNDGRPQLQRYYTDLASGLRRRADVFRAELVGYFGKKFRRNSRTDHETPIRTSTQLRGFGSLSLKWTR